MNAEERHLISDLFERLRAYGPIDKDLEAEQLIISLARNHPDAGYMLVQNILVQEQTIAQMQQEIEDLQAQLAQAQRGGGARSGGFLGGAVGNSGGMFGGSRGSVPQTAPAPRQAHYAPPPQPAPANPWGRAAPAQPQAPAYQPQPAPAPAPAQASGGGFMRSAMGMAAGVAGGMLAANAIKNMMGGGQSGNQPASSDFGSNDPGNTDTSGDNYGYGNTEEQGYAADDNDPGTDFGGDSGGEEF